MRVLVVVLGALALLAVGPGRAAAQEHHPAAPSSSLGAPPTPSRITTSILLPTSTHFAPPSATTSLASAGTSPEQASAVEAKPGPHTKLDATFAVLGVILILSGLPTAFLGVRKRSLSFFVVAFDTAALAVACLILHFNVVGADSPPSSSTRALYLFACVASGLIAGAGGVIGWKATQYLAGAAGGFVAGLYILAFVGIKQLVIRYAVLLPLVVIGFVGALVPQATQGVVMVSTALIGASGFVLGMDCLTTSNLKELYIFSLGFQSLFPKLEGHFPLTSKIYIELAVLGALAAAALAYQAKGHALLVKVAKELQTSEDEQLKQEEKAARRMSSRLEEAWCSMAEKLHPDRRQHGSRIVLLDAPTPSSNGSCFSSASPSPFLLSPDPSPRLPSIDREPAFQGVDLSAGGTFPIPRFGGASKGFGQSRNVPVPPRPLHLSKRAQSVGNAGDWEAQVRRDAAARGARQRTKSAVPTTATFGTVGEFGAMSHHHGDENRPLSLIVADNKTQLPPRVARHQSLDSFPSRRSLPDALRPMMPHSVSMSSVTRPPSRSPTLMSFVEENSNRPGFRHTPPPPPERIVIGHREPSPAPPPAPTRVLPYHELEARHRRRLSSIQSDITQEMQAAAAAAALSKTSAPTMQTSASRSSLSKRVPVPRPLELSHEVGGGGMARSTSAAGSAIMSRTTSSHGFPSPLSANSLSSWGPSTASSHQPKRSFSTDSVRRVSIVLPGGGVSPIGRSSSTGMPNDRFSMSIIPELAESAASRVRPGDAGAYC